MNTLFHNLALRCLHRLPAETAHNLTLASLRLAAASGIIASDQGNTRASVTAALGCANRLGLAAGFDKDGRAIDGLAALGFGFIELGTVTPRPQPGNPKPRLFRLPEHHAIINRMGFNNLGVHQLADSIRKSKAVIVKGVNIGKNRDTPLDQAVDDYLYCLQVIYHLADYVVINISSPNTPELRKLQFGKPLKKLLERLARERDLLAAKSSNKQTPVLVKIAPDIESNDLERLVRLVNDLDLDGLVATNTTLDKSLVAGHPDADQEGGLSGPPLFQSSLSLIADIKNTLKPGRIVIGVGGISCARDARQMIAAGADLIQIYTGFIYQGKKLIEDICSLNEISAEAAGQGGPRRASPSN